MKTVAKAEQVVYRDGMDSHTWVTHDGRKVRVHDMHDQHLTNALRVIWKARDLTMKISHKPKNEIEAALYEMIPCYQAMIGEMRARGLLS